MQRRSENKITYDKKQSALANRLRKRRDTGVDKSPHLIVEARAGTGKTTTLVEGLKYVMGQGKSQFAPSTQQDKIWEAMAESAGKVLTVCFVAFNKSIATELQQRVPSGCAAMTMHSMGYRAVRRAFPDLGSINSYRVQDIISELLETDIRELRRTKPEVLQATEKLVNLCKMNLIGGVAYGPSGGQLVGDGTLNPQITELAAHYDVDLNGHAAEVFELVPRVLERCKDVARDNAIDFADMIWLPIVLDLNVYKYDLLLVDEAQDLNRCQQALALKAGRRLILCGDPKQAIYGFAGADSQSMVRMAGTLAGSTRGCITLPLTVTRRCGKAIVKEAQKLVPDFEAHESCGDGFVANLRYKPSASDGDCKKTRDGSHSFNMVYGKDDNYTCLACGCVLETPCYRGYVADGDMVLCRVNAPLVSECFKFLRAGRKANIQGRDVGQGLTSTIRKMRAGSVLMLLESLDDWLHKEGQKENAKRNPSEARLIALHDRYDCLCCFCEDETTVDGVVRKIEAVFTDDKEGVGIKLSSVHKAKGLEAKRVFLLQPEGATIPHPMAKSQWQRDQEMNLLYVAITRSIEELVYVS